MIRILTLACCCLFATLLHAQSEKRIERKVGTVLDISLGASINGGCVDCKEDERFCRFRYVAENHYRFEEDNQFSLVSYHQLDQMKGIKAIEDCDSIAVFDRYVNCLGWEVSETEGVVLLDTSWSGLKAEEVFAFSPWHKVPQRTDYFDFTHYQYFDFIDYKHPSLYSKKRLLPLVSITTANAILDQHPEQKEQLYGDRERPCRTFSYLTQIKVVLYKGDTTQTIILDFHHRHGEC